MEGDPQFMRRAIALAEQGMNGGHGGPFGAVVVQDGAIIGEGHNRVLETHDPSAHGEVVAIRDAARRVENPWLEGSDLYSSCEPCPMCLATALWARISRIFFACTKFDAATIGFDDHAFYEELRIDPKKQLIALHSMMRDDAWKVMEQWLVKKDRVGY